MGSGSDESQEGETDDYIPSLPPQPHNWAGEYSFCFLRASALRDIPDELAAAPPRRWHQRHLARRIQQSTLRFSRW